MCYLDYGEYLGHIINSMELRTSTKKVKTVQEHQYHITSRSLGYFWDFFIILLYFEKFGLHISM